MKKGRPVLFQGTRFCLFFFDRLADDGLYRKRLNRTRIAIAGDAKGLIYRKLRTGTNGVGRWPSSHVAIITVVFGL
jgi:hypothetical protein